jgi:ankyrin repeat protein
MAVYKRVVLIGKNRANPINKDQCNKDCIVIGNRDKGFSLNDLNMLKGKIDFSTRIDIIGHGISHKDIHRILSNHASVYEYTANILSKLSYLGNDEPLYVHLWSCFGGAANKDVSKLAKGSILVTHGLENHSVAVSIDNFAVLKSFSKDGSSDHFAELSRDILDNSMQTSAININSKNKVEKLHFGKKLKLVDLISNPRKAISEELESLSKQAELENIKFEIQEYSDEEVNNFVKGYLIHLAMINSFKLKDFLKNPNIPQESLKLFLNDVPFEDSAIRVAAGEGHSHKELVEILAEAGADLNLVGSGGATALYIAAQNGHKELVEILIKAGVDLNLASDEGLKPFDIALCLNKDNVVELLFNSHMKSEQNDKVFISRTIENIKKFCPSELGDFMTLIKEYEHNHTEL